MPRVVWYLGHNSNCYNYVVGVDLFSSNNIHVARCSRDTGSKYGSQESGSARVAMVFLHTYVANGGVNSAVQKRLNRSRCCSGFGLGWAHGIMY